jgi:acyl-CoA thioesterase I
MIKLVPGRWTSLIVVAAMAMPLACKRSNADDNLPAATGAASAKASRAPSSDSVRAATGAVPSASHSRAGQAHTVIFVGTSLTAGLGLDPDSAYPQLIQQKIDAAHLPFEVVNAGVSGETTAGLLRRLDWLLRGNFDVIVVESGANDGLRGTPVATVKENLRTILSRIRQAHPHAKLFLVQMEAPPNLGPEYTNAFHALFGDVAKENGATLVPFLLQDVAGDRDLNQADGIHPNQRGEQIVAENVWKSVEPALRQAATGT